MSEVILRMVDSVVIASLFCISTLKMLGAMQQSGYKNGVFWRWLRRKDNLQYNRLCVFALCLALTTAIVSLCFSFLGTRGALLVSAIPFFLLCILYLWADGKFALKVATKHTGRLHRLFVAYFFLVACITYFIIALLSALSTLNGSSLYALVAFVPVAILPALLPMLLCAANAIMGIFENARNKKFVKRAGQVLDETKIIRIGIVGSYAKTSVKNILYTLLKERYACIATPQSYNTPIGIAKTVLSDDFAGKEILIVEMGARKAGDITELCSMVKPDYILFTGICEQHVHTFGSLEGVWTEKKQALFSGAKLAVCGAGLQERISKESFSTDILYADKTVGDVALGATDTSFTLTLGEEKIAVKTSLLGNAAVENISLAATLAHALGLTANEMQTGLQKLQPIPHRLQLIENGGAYILDDGYNCNPVGAKEGIAALCRFDGRKCVVTPGIIECGVLEESINEQLGQSLANAGLDKVILVGETLVGAVKTGYKNAGGDEEKLQCVKTLADAQGLLAEWISAGDAVLFLNDLPDVY